MFLHCFRECETVAFTTSYSDHYTLSEDKNDASIPLTGIPQQGSIECRLQVGELDEPTSWECKSGQILSNVGLEQKPESTLYEQHSLASSRTTLHTEQTSTVQISTTSVFSLTYASRLKLKYI